MGKRSVRTWMIDNAYLVTLGCVIAMVAGCALYTQALRQAQAAGIQAAADAPEIRETAAPSATPDITPLPTIAPLTLRPVSLVPSGGAWPLDGEILRTFDAQNGIYWQALGTWQTHTALDIAGEPGDEIKACMDGIVTNVSRDSLWGLSITIAHDSGRETRYAGLESSAVQENARITRGQTIGTLQKGIPCEAELPTHLHLEMRRNGKMQDPEAILEER